MGVDLTAAQHCSPLCACGESRRMLAPPAGQRQGHILPWWPQIPGDGYKSLICLVTYASHFYSSPPPTVLVFLGLGRDLTGWPQCLFTAQELLLCSLG